MPTKKDLRKTPVFRYFFYKANPTVGVPKVTLEEAIKAAAIAALPPPPPQPLGGAGGPHLPVAPPDSQGSYGAMHEDEGIEQLADFFAEQGVASQTEFDELATLMEQKAMIGGARRRKSRRNRKSRKSRRARRYSRR
jgi:hypothetical protein